MSYLAGFEAGLRTALAELGELQEVDGLPEDLATRVLAGELTMDQAEDEMDRRAWRSAARIESLLAPIGGRQDG